LIFDFKKHIQSVRHMKKVEEEDEEEEELNLNKQHYVCESCNYITDRKGNYLLHVKSQKHLDIVNSTTTSKFKCQYCNKLYSGTNNLWKHMKKCKENKKDEEGEEESEDEEKDESEDEEDEESSKSATNRNKLKTRELFMEVIRKSDEVQKFLIKQNEELMRHILEMSKQQATITNNSHNNSNNTTNTQFNLQVFLNEQCKDALDIMDFVDSLDINVSDLEETGKLGFIDGITRIFANGLNKLDLYKRPIHCTDLKREMLYIKDKNKWEKEVDGKPIFKKAVNRVSNMNLRQLKKWQELNPGYDIVDTEKNDEFIHLSTQAIGSCSSQETDRNLNKIMKNLYKQVVLDKKDGALKNVK
jgi:hypothetical protein